MTPLLVTAAQVCSTSLLMQMECTPVFLSTNNKVGTGQIAMIRVTAVGEFKMQDSY